MPNTTEQRNYLKGMQTLVELYHLLKASRGEKWISEHVMTDFPEAIIKKMTRLFYYTLPCFDNVQYYSDRGVFRYGTNTEIAIFKKRHILSFLEIMLSLHRDITYKRHKKAITVYTLEHGVLEQINYGPGQEQTLARIFGWKRPKYEDLNASGPKIEVLHTPPVNRNDEQLKVYVKNLSKKLGDGPRYGEVFEVKYNFIKDHEDTFADALHDAVLDNSPIMAPTANTRISFIKVMRYILVKYVALFGSLSRFKACHVCGAFIFQQCRDDKKTCSNGKCRTAAFRERQTLKEQKMSSCRSNQNSWIDSTVENHEVCRGKDIEPQKIKAVECRNLCSVPGDEYPGSGKCKILQNRNATVMELLDEFKKSGRKRSSRKYPDLYK